MKTLAALTGGAHPAVNPQLVAFAEHILAQVKAGKVSTLAAVLVSPLGNIETPIAGTQGAEAYLGADVLKQQILNAMQRPSPLVRAS